MPRSRSSRFAGDAPMPDCQVCSMPRPQRREDWPAYQQAVLEHLRVMRSEQDVRDHEYARRRWLGEDASVTDAVRAQVSWWQSVSMLDEHEAQAEIEREKRQQQAGAA